MKFFFRVFFAVFFLLLIVAVSSKTLPPRGVIPVLAYHSIGTKEDSKELKNFVSRGSFALQMAYLYYFGYKVITPAEYEKIIRGEVKPRGREILLTFDDANQTFDQEVFPVLKQYNFPVLLFVISESMKQGINASMPQEALQELLDSGLITLGSGSKTHPLLSALTESQMRDEVAGSKEDLEKMFKTPILYFAYPNGDIDPYSITVLKSSGYRLAFTTSHHKLAALGETPYTLTRLKITRSSDNPIVFWVKATGLYQIHKENWQKLKAWLQNLKRPA